MIASQLLRERGIGGEGKRKRGVKGERGSFQSQVTHFIL